MKIDKTRWHLKSLIDKTDEAYRVEAYRVSIEFLNLVQFMSQFLNISIVL